MRFLHTMVRISDETRSLRFFCEGLGLQEVARKQNEAAKFTLIFLACPKDIAALPVKAKDQGKDGKPAGLRSGLPMIELTHNWGEAGYDGGRNFGHLAFEVDDIYETCAHLVEMGVVINRPPRDGYMAFVRSPDGISVELLQKGKRLDAAEPWLSMRNEGEW